MAINFELLNQGGPSNFFEGYTQAGEKMQANALAQQRATQAQQEFGMRQQEFAATQADKRRAANTAIVLQKTQAGRDALLRAATPEVARAIVKAQYLDPDLASVKSRFGTLEQDLAEVPDDPTAFQQYKEREAMGIEAFLKQQAGDRAYGAIMGGAPVPAPANALAPAPVQPAAAPFEPAPGAVPIRQGFAPGTFVTTFDGSGTPVTAPANALAPAAAPAPAPVNALVPQPAATPQAQDPTQSLKQKRDQLSAIPDQTPRIKATIENLNKDIERLSNAPPEVKLLRALNLPITEANIQKLETLKKSPSDFESLLAGTNLSDAEKTALRVKKALKETTHAPGTTVSMVSERAEQGARGKMLVDQYGDIAKAAGLAARTLPSIEVNLSSLNKGFDTGFGKETIAAGASVLAALGVKDAEKFATDTQKFQSNAISAVLQKQLEQKGPQTESDARRIEQIGAQLGKTKQANEFILSMAGEQLRRDIDQRNFYDRWYKTNKTYDGAEDAWFNSEGGKSLFDRPGLKKYAGGPSASSQIPSNAPIVSPAAKTIVNPKFPGFSIGKP